MWQWREALVENHTVFFKYKMHDAETKPEEHNGMFSTRIAKTIRNGLNKPYLPYPQTS
jgi:hypothetical protein